MLSLSITAFYHDRFLNKAKMQYKTQSVKVIPSGVTGGLFLEQ